MKALLVDFINYEIRGEITIQDWPNTIEGMYYKTAKGPIPVAYCFKVSDRQHIEGYLNAIKERERAFNTYRSRVITQDMRKHRIDQ